MSRAFALLGLLLLPTLLAAHTTEFLGGRLSRGSDGVVELRLEVLAQRLPLFAGELAGAYTTVADLRAAAPELSARFQESLFVFVGGKETAPSAVVWPTLQQPNDDGATLPEFVPIAVRWRDLPIVPASVIPRFDLAETYVMLVLEEQRGGTTASPRAASESGAEATATGETAEPAEAPLEPSWGRTLGRALVIGYEHIVPYGLDHILFVLGLFFAARRLRDLVAQVTMFTIAHSLTLGLAMAGVVGLSDTWARVVEIGIAVSIVVVAVENCVVRQNPGWRRLAIVGGFGLIHGLGFAGALSAVNWPADRFLPALVAANVGIELGQLTIVGGAALLVAWIWRREWYRGRVAIPASVAIGMCGLYWAVTRTLGAI